MPEVVEEKAREYFLTEVLAFLQPVVLQANKVFFPENNKLYFIVNIADAAGKEQLVLLNIPSDELKRFFTIDTGAGSYIVFLDDIIRSHLDKVFSGQEIKGCYSIKVTRDAELDLKDEYSGDVSDEIEKQLKKRDLGLATRFLHQSGIPLRILQLIIQRLDMQDANITEGGRYHNLKDLFFTPCKFPRGIIPEMAGNTPRRNR